MEVNKYAWNLNVLYLWVKQPVTCINTPYIIVEYKSLKTYITWLTNELQTYNAYIEDLTET